MFSLRSFFAAAFTLAFCAACASTYVPPGRGAKLQEIAPQASTDASIQAILERKPAAGWPATVALVRVQEQGYRSYSWEPKSSGGKWTVVGVREAEKPEHLARLRALPDVRDVALASSLLVPEQIGSDTELRAAAARMQADLLLLYTFDTTFHERDDAPILTLVTLGIAPTRVSKVAATAQCVLLDVRSGYFYGSAEATERRELRQSTLGKEEDFESQRITAEELAFEKLLAAFETTWPAIVAQHAGTAPAAVPAASGR
ncbi:MAG: hypothetical protein HZA53_08860 [Planctomycetes bacterium]|nr:hypothetical protein [Planctomycetota bacterium]